MTLLPDADLLESLDATDLLKWADAEFEGNLVVTCSFTSPVLPHLVSRAMPDAEIVLLDTQYLFAETLWYARRLERDYGLNLTVVEPAAGVTPDLWQTDVEACCHARKVEPLERALAGRAAWVTGLRRSESASRTNARAVTHDLMKGIVKVNPIVGWSDDDVAEYTAEHGLPEHPLVAKGYPSIGCWPCTNPVAPGADPRSGRWAGLDKTECGLHR
jgi:phosphoadenosine phosphosulfate reductase